MKSRNQSQSKDGGPSQKRLLSREQLRQWAASLARLETKDYRHLGHAPSRICRCSDHPDAFRCRRREHRQVWIELKGRSWCPCWCHDAWTRPDVPPDARRPPWTADPPAE